MKELNFPLLRANQIEVRVGQVSAKGCSLLLYKTSRTDAEILDRVVGQGNWQKRFYTLQGVGIGDQVRSIVVCSVGIYDDDKHEWIWKDDSGTESQVEQDKGVCSDAFKRASGGSCWGIGRELYYTGFIFVKVSTQLKSNGRGYELTDKYMSFEVKEIEWNENPLTLKKLIIVDNNGNVVFSVGGKRVEQPKKEENPSDDGKENFEEENKPIRKEEKEWLQEYVGQLDGERYNAFFEWLKSDYGVSTIGELNAIQGIAIVERLKRVKKK